MSKICAYTKITQHFERLKQNINLVKLSLSAVTLLRVRLSLQLFSWSHFHQMKEEDHWERRKHLAGWRRVFAPSRNRSVSWPPKWFSLRPLKIRRPPYLALSLSPRE
jgi:hypothetical protein